MISYASLTRGARNLETLRASGWRLLLVPEGGRVINPPAGFRFALDNGAWTAFKRGLPFDTAAFEDLVDHHGAAADFVVIPDKVADRDSLEFSKLWIDYLKHLHLILLPVQDGMKDSDVGALLERYPNMGIFLGGSTEWKLRTMYGWGMVAHAFRRYYHIARVNSCRRIRLAIEAGADSIDGTSASRYSSNVPRLHAATLQPSLISPEVIA